MCFSRFYRLRNWRILDDSNEISSAQGRRFGVKFSQLFLYMPGNKTVSQILAEGAKSREILANVESGRNLFMNFDTSHFHDELRENKSAQKKIETRNLTA